MTTAQPASAPTDETAWGWVLDARLDLADRLDRLARGHWDRPSLCAGWRIRDAVGHLVWLAEAQRATALVDLMRQLRPPNAALSRIARREGDAKPAELVDRLRAAAAGRFVVPTAGPLAVLGEVYVHGSDALRPTDVAPRPADERTGLVAVEYRKRSFRVVFRSHRASRVRFTATDAGWSVGPPEGPAASGPGEAVLLALAGRPHALDDLEGPGVAHLRR